MKKSEMAKVLADAIDSHFEYTPDMGAGYDYEGILDTLIEAGMLPPNYIRDLGDEDPFDGEIIYKWEEEE